MPPQPRPVTRAMLPDSRTRRALLTLAGLLTAGEGLIVLMGIVDHGTPPPVAATLIGVGLACLLLAGRKPNARATGASPRRRMRPWIVALLGATLMLGVPAYHLAAGSPVGRPQLVMIAYGGALLGAAPALDRRILGAPVNLLVAYSFPLLLGPLALFAAHGLLSSPPSPGPLNAYVLHTYATPTTWIAGALGLEVAQLSDTLRVTTPRGPLFLTVGLVCTGLYATILFLGVFALFAWQSRAPPARLALYLVLGVVGMHLANLARLGLLVVVGAQWGGAMLHRVHEHAGWILFIAWSLLFWTLVLRDIDRAHDQASTQAHADSGA